MFSRCILVFKTITKQNVLLPMWKAERMNEVLSTFTALQTSRCLSSTALTAAGSLTP